jgi:hypothetical protein
VREDPKQRDRRGAGRHQGRQVIGHAGAIGRLARGNHGGHLRFSFSSATAGIHCFLKRSNGVVRHVSRMPCGQPEETALAEFERHGASALLSPLWNDRHLRKRAVPADTAGCPEIARLNAYRLSFHQRSWANRMTIRRAPTWTSSGLSFNRYATGATYVLRRSRTGCLQERRVKWPSRRRSADLPLKCNCIGPKGRHCRPLLRVAPSAASRPPRDARHSVKFAPICLLKIGIYAMGVPVDRMESAPRAGPGTRENAICDIRATV